MPVKLAIVVVGGAAIFAVLQLCWYVFDLVIGVKVLGLRKEREGRAQPRMRGTCLLVSVSGTYLHANTGSIGQMSNFELFEAAEASMCSSLALYSAIYSEVRCLDTALSQVSERVGELGAGRSILQLWMARVCQALTFRVRGGRRP